MKQHSLNDCITMEQDLTYAAVEQVSAYAAEQPFAVILPIRLTAVCS